jgi:ABC-type antimicrobial peptide transport system permease subunit
MLGFVTGTVVGLLFLMIDSSVLVGLNIAEILVAIIWIIIIYGCFGAIVDRIIQFIQKIKRRK